MAAPAWGPVFGGADTGATTVTATAHADTDTSVQVVLAIIVGVVAAPTAITFPAGITATPLTGIITTTNSWYRVYRITDLSAGEAVVANVGASAKFMSLALVAYPGSGIGNLSALAVKAGTTANLVLPALTKADAASTVVDVWTARDAGTGTLTSVTDGTIRGARRGTGSNNTVVAISDRTAATAVTGVFSASSGNGGGLQVEVLPLATTPPPSDPWELFMVVDGVEVPMELFMVVDGVEVPYVLT